MIEGTISFVTSLLRLLNISKAVNDSKDSAELVKKIREANDENRRKYGLISTKGSITKLVNITLIEPSAVVSTNLKNEPYLHSILTLLTDMFTAYFVNAMNIIVTLYEETPLTGLNLLSTENYMGHIKQDMLTQLLNNKLTFEDNEDTYDDAFNKFKQTVDKYDIFNRENGPFATKKVESIRNAKRGNIVLKSTNVATLQNSKDNPLEAILERHVDLKFTGSYKTTIPITGLKTGTVEEKEKWAKENGLVYSRATDKFYNPKEYPNEEKHEIIIPLTIRTSIMFVSDRDIINGLAPSNKYKEFGFRFNEYRAGLISLMDFIFVNDLIKEYKQNKINDKSGFLALLKERELNANKKLLSPAGMIGYEKYYNMLVITKEEAAILEREIGGKLDNHTQKNMICDKANAMFIAVVDRDAERVIIYTKDIKGVSNIRISDIVRRNDKTYNNDLLEFIKAISVSRPITF